MQKQKFSLIVTLILALYNISPAHSMFEWEREEDSSSPLTQQQRTLREAILKGTHVESDLPFYAQKNLARFNFL